MNGAITFLSNTPSWRCVQLKNAQGHVYIYLSIYNIGRNTGNVWVNRDILDIHCIFVTPFDFVLTRVCLFRLICINLNIRIP